MGCSFILEIKKPHVAPAWLLAVCIMLLLMSGAEAIVCEYCTIMNPEISKVCVPFDNICRRTDGYCLTLLTYEGNPKGPLKRVDKRCVEKESKLCGMQKKSKDKKLHYAVVCCDENNRCAIPRNTEE